MSSVSLKEYQIPAKVNRIYVDPATVPMHWTRIATAGSTKTIPLLETDDEIQIDWGDGSALEIFPATNGASVVPTHTYTTS
jgi:hypothetical protein